MSDSTIPTFELPDVPFRGAESFRLIDHPIFFERKADTRRLLQELVIHRGVLLYGESGAGKSSLINAGLIPSARDEGFVPDRIRLKNHRSGEIIIERISLKDDGRPPFLNPSLASDGGDGDRVVLSIDDFKKRLFEFANENYPLLIFDQFEEFATLFEGIQGDSAEAQRNQAAILDLLIELLRHRELRVKMLFSFREDYLAKLTKLFTRSPELQQQYVRLTPPTTDALHEILSGAFKDPALREHFAAHSPSGSVFSDALINGLESDFRGRSAAGVLNLTEVQLACLELWNSKDPQQLYAKENVAGLLRLVLERGVAKLAEHKLREQGVALLSFMVTSFGTRNVISEYDLLDQVRSVGNYDEQDLRAALDLLVTESKIVRRVVLRELPHYEIVSEFFAPWIAERRREREKLKAEKEQKFNEGALRLRKVGAWAATIAAFLFAVFIGVSLWVQFRRGELADARAQLASLQKEKAELARETKILEDEKDEALKARADAEIAREKAEQLMQEAERRASLQVSALNKKRIEELTEQIDSMKSSIDEYNKMLGIKDSRISELQTQLESLRSGEISLNFPQATPGPNPVAASIRSGIIRRRNMLFGSTILEVALTLVLIYLLLSVICFAVIELVEIFRHRRSQTRWLAIVRLCGGDLDFARRLCHHPLLEVLGAQEGRWPLSISPHFFALTFLNVLGMSRSSVPPPHLSEKLIAIPDPQLHDFYDKVAAMPNDYLRQVLLSLTTQANNISEAIRDIENWYQSSMKVPSAVYRRGIMMQLLACAFALSFGLNLDTINVANSVQRSASLPADTLAATDDYDNEVARIQSNLSKTPATSTGAKEASPRPSPYVTPTPRLMAWEDLGRTRANRNDVDANQIPIGWTRTPGDPRSFQLSSSGWIYKILGISITTLVATLLAQFLLIVSSRFFKTRVVNP